MSPYKVENSVLISESDVEQKVILPLITNPEPEGLGFSNLHYQTKNNLRKLNIDKGNASKVYFPDYIILVDGIPLVVIEAKKPNENLSIAYSEARLYSTEINSYYKANINPCHLIIVTDGLKLLAGYWDNMNPVIELNVDDWSVTNSNFGWFIETFGCNRLKKISKELREQVRTNVYYKKPLHLLGGKSTQNRQTKNTFGETISIQYRHLFNPEEEAERTDIVKNAYVKVDKHLSHVDPIDKIIRKKISPSIVDSIEIENNLEPTEIIGKLNDAHLYNNQVLLLIGSVGSGKSTFTTYLKDVALDRTLAKKICWIRIDLNNAPVNPTEIYRWIKEIIIKELVASNSEIDVDDIDTIKKIYHTQIIRFNKLAGVLLGEGSEEYNKQLFNEIKTAREDIDVSLESYISYFVHSFHKELIIVLDNCDKRTLEEQLLMFEVANWLKENIKSIVFLPLRETTFDHYRNEKPLDTVIKDLTFRINPPSLNKVLYNRINYAKRGIDKKQTNFYTLSNGFKASYPSSDEIFYLRSIMKSLFQNKFFNKLMSGLTGRNIRKGIEIFLDFCKSGHITDSEIFQMKYSKGTHILQNHIISRIFLRGNRVYYSDAETKLKNLFSCDPSDKLPDPFVRVKILQWLNLKSRIKGPSGILGYHMVSDLIKDLSVFGHEEDRIFTEIKNLMASSLVLSESQNNDKIELDELISINSSGLIHLELLKNVDYLSSCSEDTWFSDDNVATEILSRINKDSSHYSIETSYANAKSLVNYLVNYQSKFFNSHELFLSDSNANIPMNFEEALLSIKRFEEGSNISPEKLLKNGSIVNGKIIKILRWGILFEIENNKQGAFAHTGDVLDEDFYTNGKFNRGDVMQLKIKSFNPKHSKYTVMLHNNTMTS